MSKTVEVDLRQDLRDYSLNRYLQILTEKNVPNSEKIAKDLELGTFDYALVKGDNNQKHVENYYRQIFIKMLGNLSFNKNSDYVIDKLSQKDSDWNCVDIPSYPRHILFPEKWESIHKEIKEENKNIVIRRKGAHKCPRCKSWYTTHIEVQTRSADESATIKCNCTDCGHNWKFG